MQNKICSAGFADCESCRTTGILTCPPLFPWKIFICPDCDGRGYTTNIVIQEIRPVDHVNITLIRRTSG